MKELVPEYKIIILSMKYWIHRINITCLLGVFFVGNINAYNMNRVDGCTTNQPSIENYNPELSYGLLCRVVQYGCVVESLVDDNTYIPMIWDGDELFTLDATHWRIISGNPRVWASSANKPAASEHFPNNGMGRVVLEKNKPLAAQLLQTNTVYVIRYDFDLSINGGNSSNSVIVPEGSVLYFEGGSLRNGILVGNNTNIVADTRIFSNTVSFSGTFNCRRIESYWWDVRDENPVYDNRESLQKGIDLASINKGGIFHISGGTIYVNVVIEDKSYPFWYTTTGALNMKSNVHVLMDTGTTIRAIDNLEQRYVLFMFFQVNNASIEGGAICGDLETNAGARDETTYPNGNVQVKGEHGHGVAIYSSNNISINNCKIRYFHGDGIYVGRHYDYTTYPVDRVNYSMVPHDIFIHNNEIGYNGRQGISICGVINSLVKDNYIMGTGQLYFPSQGYGIDIEPNGILEDEVVDGLIIDNCTFNNNEMGAMMAADFTSYTEFRIHNVSINSCASTSLGRLDMRLCDVYGINISNCVINFLNISRFLKKNELDVYVPARSVNNTDFLKFFNCTFNEGIIEFENYAKDVVFLNCCKYQKGAGNICVDYQGNNSNVFFNNCGFYQNNRTKILVYLTGSNYDKIIYNNCSFVTSSLSEQGTDNVGTHNNSVWVEGPIYY